MPQADKEITLQLLARRMVRHIGQQKMNFPIGTDTTCHHFVCNNNTCKRDSESGHMCRCNSEGVRKQRLRVCARAY